MAEAGAFLEEFSEAEKAKLENLRFGVIVGRFYEDLALRLLDGADHGFKLAGAPIGNVEHFSVPGAYYLPFAAKSYIDGVRRKNAREGGGPEVGGVACLGVVIRGETDHYDHVAGSVTSGIARVGLDTGVPTIFGVLTTDSVEQGLNRSGLKAGNNGYEAAVAAIEMATLLKKIPE